MTSSLTIEDLSSRVDAELNSIVTANEMPLYRMMSYHMGWNNAQGVSEPMVSGERVHGVLCLLACGAVGGDVEVALPAAAAVELVHNFMLIHDDVQGGNPQRDNRDAVWWVWGPAQAINAGDGMHALARLAMFRLLERGVSAEATFHAVQVLDEASLRTCEGRFLDLEAQEKIDLSVDAYLKMASDKMGALLSCAMKLGALMGASDDSRADALGECGAKLGLAMQIQADLQELWGSRDDKSAASTEVMNKKKLLPVVYAWEKAEVSDKRRLGEIYFKRVLEPDDVSKVRGIIEELGAKAACEGFVAQYRTEAIAALDAAGGFPEGKPEIQKYIDKLLG